MYIFLVIVFLIVTQVMITRSIKEYGTTDSNSQIQSLISDKGWVIREINIPPITDQLIYSSDKGKYKPNYYHVDYIDNNGIEKTCEIQKYLGKKPTLFKESI